MTIEQEQVESAEPAKPKKKKQLQSGYGSARLQISYSQCSEASPHEIVWLNEDSGLLHRLNSRWDGKTLVGRYIEIGEALESGCRSAGNAQ